ncbi:hypothetical protein LGH70_09740 [Hymenobacter sp. BT635]|uniref:Uncharacterized protein n=1 Tax=Hymenobacter nitidus TaxID=2880929 RepID=A0ABS8ABR6_9BACT|nr:hypothetical protein [Hymenobacter nitidus]MCB2377863.1 hypothetical protein [Hymenobacter nitidus]
MKSIFLTSRLALLALATAGSLSLVSCFGSDSKEEDPAPDAVSESLHFAFKTPDWERQIDCTHLNLSFNPLYNNPKIAIASATSGSTYSTFHFAYPADSSALVASTNLRKYPITKYGMGRNAFEFSHKLPPTEGSNSRLESLPGMSDNAYNEILAVKYAGHQGKYALFDIKAKYAMLMKGTGADSTAPAKPVTGSFKFRLRANSK